MPTHTQTMQIEGNIYVKDYLPAEFLNIDTLESVEYQKGLS